MKTWLARADMSVHERTATYPATGVDRPNSQECHIQLTNNLKN